MFKFFFSIIYLFIILEGCGNTIKKSEESVDKSVQITIASAANMQFAIKELTRAFTDSNGIKCDIRIGSSGNLTAQISEGASYDVFVAADMMYPNNLYEKGLAESPPVLYAAGRLVLWTMKDDVNPSLVELTTDKIKHIAIANPQLAPYGEAAVQALSQHNLLENVRHKLVFGESIAQTNQFITSGSAEIGFTAMAVVLAPQMKDRGRWTELGRATYDPIDQGVIIIKRENDHENTNGNNSASRQFVDFLFSPKARTILKDFGYLVNE